MKWYHHLLMPFLVFSAAVSGAGIITLIGEAIWRAVKP